jgi:hypothetical protein
MALRRSRVRIPLGPLAKDEPLTIPVERFVCMSRYDSKGKFEDWELELSLCGLKSSRSRFESLQVKAAQAGVQQAQTAVTQAQATLAQVESALPVLKLQLDKS